MKNEHMLRKPVPGEPSRYWLGVRRLSVVERWAHQVVRGTSADEDLKTIPEWARHVGVSPSSLREICRLLGIRPHDACSLVRTLRALIKSSDCLCAPDLLLDVSDRRTLRTLLAKAGPHFTLDRRGLRIEDFLRTQTFVPAESPGIKLLAAHYATQQPLAIAADGAA